MSDFDSNLDKLCGTVFSTVRGAIAFICSLCEGKYLCCEDFLLHLSQVHLIGDVCYKRKQSSKDASSISKTAEYNQVDNFDIESSYRGSDPLGVNSTNADDEDFEEDGEFDEFLKCDSDEFSETTSTKRKLLENPVKMELISDSDSWDNLVTNCDEADLLTNYSFDSLQGTFDNAKCKEQPDSNAQLTPKTGHNNERLLSKHQLETSLNGKSIKCLNCHAIYSDLQEFRDHLKEHPNYICQICFAGYSSKRRLDCHMNAINANMDCALIPRPFKCNFCDFKFNLKAKLTVHLNAHFDKGTSHQCSYCPKKFGSSLGLQIHQRAHTNEKPFKCHICSGTFSSRGIMENHIFRHSEKNKKFECSDCQKKFFTRTELKMHSTVHTKEKSYLCSDCGLSFPVLTRLNQHKKVYHTIRERNFKCDICSHRSFDRGSLRKHMATHSEARKHLCSVCNTAFKTHNTLANHLKLHENKRSHKCDRCPKRFNQRSALVSHRKNVHNK